MVRASVTLDTASLRTIGARKELALLPSIVFVILETMGQLMGLKRLSNPGSVLGKGLAPLDFFLGKKKT